MPYQPRQTPLQDRIAENGYRPLPDPPKMGRFARLVAMLADVRIRVR